MNYDEVSKVVVKELKKSGYDFKEIRSVSTNSIYYKMYDGPESLLFRVSDHWTKKDVITFRVDYKTNYSNLTSFVQNRVKDLSYRSVKSFLGMR